MIINWVTIRVKDFEQSKAFYGDFLGLQPEREFSPNPEMQIAFFSAENGMQIELIHSKGAEAGNTGVSIGMTTSNYTLLLEKARQYKIITGEPAVLGGHMECFFVKDPDGVEIQIVKP